MKSPAMISENGFFGSITSSSIRNLLPKSISVKQKSISDGISRSNDENALPVDPNVKPDDNQSALQFTKQSLQKFFPSASRILRSETKDDETLANSGEPIEEKRMGLGTIAEENQNLEARSMSCGRTNSVSGEITEEDDSLGVQIRELKEELVRTKSDGCKPNGSKSGHFERDSLSQLRVSINKSLLMSSAKKDESKRQDMNVDDEVMELHKHIEKLHGSSDSIQSSFANASCGETDSISEDEICSEYLDKPKHGHQKCVASVHNDPSDLKNVGFDVAGNGSSTSSQHPACILEEPVFSESPKLKSFQKSMELSTKYLASSRNMSEGSAIGNNIKVDQAIPSMSKKLSGPTDSLAASLQRGLQIMDYHQRSSLSNRSSVSFSFGHLPLKPCREADNHNNSVQSLKEDKPSSIGGCSTILLCLSCRRKLDQEADATEEAVYNEKHLKNMCIAQATKIEELTRMLSRKSVNDEDGAEIGKETHETEQVRNFDPSEKEALLKEIAELKSKLPPTKSADNLRSSLLLRSIQMRKSIDVTKNSENSEVLEKEREMWTEMESDWISLTDDLRSDIDYHRNRAENLELEFKQEKIVTEELNDALTRAMFGHSRFIEQYTELQEKYNELEESYGVMMAGITDVKKAAAKAAMKGRHGKNFAKAFSAELSAIRAEKEKEREFLKKENKSLRAQLQDTAEAVQAAGELLVRLEEAEQASQASEERFSVVEDEKERLKNQMEKLKSKHKTEMETMKQYLAESRLPGSALLQPWYKDVEEEHVSEHRTGDASFDEYEDDQAWRAEFGAIYQDHRDHY